MSKELYEAAYRLEEAQSGLNFSLYVFGDYLAKKHGYKSVYGIDAVHYYLMQKHNWLPSVIKSMSKEDLRFCLEEEMHGWTLPKEAINVGKK